MIGKHIKVYGKVQGVFFRDSTRKKALELGIAGNVRNCDDGSVEIFAEGEKDKMDVFVEWCKSGPERAEVKSIEMEDHALKNYKSFLIIH